MSAKQKTPNYKIRSSVYKNLGRAAIATTTLSGFVVYESLIDWANFKQEMEQFVVVAEDSIKLNLAIAFPLLIAIVVFLAVTLRKNREFFKDKISVSLLLTIVIFYMIYSVIEVAMASLIGAFAGAFLDEVIFTPLSLSNRKKYEAQVDIDSEYEREKRRIKARKQAKEELDGSV